MQKTCPRCGSTEFHATQVCHGTVPVIVTLEPSGPVYWRNATPDGTFDASDLTFDNPAGPFKCVMCGTVINTD
jgi:predicted RNA-binding Zn-ribbon protein involved in translation (DUF1610 family)